MPPQGRGQDLDVTLLEERAMRSPDLGYGVVREHPSPGKLRMPMALVRIGLSAVVTVEEQDRAGIGLQRKAPLHEDEERHVSPAPQEMLRGGQRDDASLTISAQEQRARRAGLEDLGRIAQCQGLDRVLVGAPEDQVPRAKRIERLLRTEVRRQAPELDGALEYPEERRSRPRGVDP